MKRFFMCVIRRRRGRTPPQQHSIHSYESTTATFFFISSRYLFFPDQREVYRAGDRRRSHARIHIHRFTLLCLTPSLSPLASLPSYREPARALSRPPSIHWFESKASRTGASEWRRKGRPTRRSLRPSSPASPSPPTPTPVRVLA
jgi:hypothetical protein